MKIHLLTILLFISFDSFSQNDEVPFELQPTKANKILIDSLFAVTNIESILVKICNSRIDQEATLKKWSAKIIDKKKKELI